MDVILKVFLLWLLVSVPVALILGAFLSLASADADDVQEPTQDTYPHMVKPSTPQPPTLDPEAERIIYPDRAANE